MTTSKRRTPRAKPKASGDGQRAAAGKGRVKATRRSPPAAHLPQSPSPSPARQARQLELLADVARHLAGLHEPQSLIDEVVRRLNDDFGFEHVALFLIEKGDLVLRSIGGEYVSLVPPGARVAMGRGIVGWVGQTAKTYWTNDTAGDEHFVQLAGARTAAEVAVPLRLGREVIGVLNVESHRPGAFDSTDAGTLESLADLLAASLRTSQLFSQLRIRERLAEALRRVGAAVTASLDLPDVLEAICVETCAAFDTDGAVVWLLDGDANVLRAAVARGVEAQAILGQTIALDDRASIAARVIRDRRPEFINDFQHASIGVARLKRLTSAQAVLATPIVKDSQPLGALVIFDARRAQRFGEDDLAAAELLGAQAAIAIHNARLFDASRRQTQELAGLYDQMKRLNDITRAALETQDFPEMLRSLADRLGELIDADGCYITLWDESRRMAIPTAASGPQRDTYPATRPQPGEVSLTESVLAAGQPLTIESGHLSMLGLPLLVGDQKLGAAIIAFDEPHHFTPDEIALGRQASGQIALALAQAQLLQAERNRAAQLTVLQSITQIVASSLELNQIFQTVVELVQASFGYSYVSIYRLDGEVLRLGAQTGYPAESIIHAIPIASGVTGRAVRTRQVQFIPDAAADPDFLRAAHEVRSEICVPLLKEAVVLGVLNVESDAAKPLTQADADLLSTFAGEVVVAIDNARLFEAERQRVHELSLLHGIATAAAEATDEDALIERITEVIGSTLYPDNFGVMLVDGDAGLLRVHASYRSPPEVDRSPVRLGRGITGQVALDGQARNVSDVRRDSAYVTADPRTRSELCVPVGVGDRVLGVLNAESARFNAFAEADRRLLSTVAGQLATAIEKLRLFETERQQRQLAETLRETAVALSATLDFDSWLDRVLELILRVVPYDTASIMIVEDGHTRMARLRGYDQFDATLIERVTRLTFEIAAMPTLRWMAETAQPIVIPDTETDSRWTKIETAHYARSWAGAPIIVEGQAAAFFSLNKMEAGYYQAEHAERLAAFAGQAALALQNARLFKQTERRAAQLSVLNEIGQTVSALLDIDSMLEVIYQQVQRTLPLDSFHVCLYDEATDVTSYPLIYDSGLRYDVPPSPLIKNSHTAHSIRTGKPLIVNRTAEELAAMPAPQSPVGDASRTSASLLFAPLRLGARVIGTISAQSYTLNAYDREHLDLLLGVAQQAAIAIQNARLYAAQQRQRKLAETLRDMATALNATLDLNQILNRLLEGLAELIPYDSCSVMLVEGEYLRIVAGRGFPQSVADLRFSLTTDALFDEIRRTQRPLVLEDAQTDDRFGRWAGTDHVRGWMGVPLISKGAVIGNLTVDSRTPGIYAERDAEIAFAFASQAAIAIENARLYAEARARADELALLARLGEALNRAQSADETLRLGLVEAVKLVNCERGSIILLEAKSGTLQMFSHIGQPPEEVRDFGARRPTAETGTFAFSIGRGEMVEVTDSATDPRIAGRRASMSRQFTEVPLQTGAGVIGVIVVDGLPRDDRDRRLLRAIADLAAAALEKAGLLEGTRQRALALATLHATALDIGSQTELPGLLQTIVERAAQLLDASGGGLYLCDQARQEVRLVVSHTSPRDYTGVVLRYGEGAAGRVAQTGEPLIIEDYRAWPGRAAVYEDDNPFRAVLCAPMIWKGRVTGVISVLHYAEDRRFTRSDLDLLVLFASQAAVAVENTRLLDETRHRAEEQRLLYNATRDFTAALDEAAVLRAIVRHMVAALRLASCSVWRWEATQDCVVAMLHGNPAADLLDPPGTVYALADYAATRYVVEHRAPLVVRADDPTADLAEREWLKRFGYEAVLMMPLVAGAEQVYGLLELYPQPGAPDFTASDMQVAHHLAAQAAVALENTRLLTETRRFALEQRSLYDAAREFAGDLDEEAVLGAVARHFLGVLRMAHCAVSRYLPERDCVVSLIDRNADGDFHLDEPGTAYALAGYPATRRALETRQPEIIDLDDPAADKAERALLKELGFRHLLMMPLVVHEEAIGLAELYRRAGDPPFSDGDVALAASLTAQAAIALDNARLHTAATDHARELDALLRANAALLSTLELEPLLQNVLTAAMAAIPAAEKGTILLIDPNTRQLQIRAVLGYFDRRLKTFAFAGNDGYSARAVRERRPLLVTDARADAAIRYDGDIEEVREILSAVVAPLMILDEPLGVIALDATRRNAFGEADLRLLTAFANTAAAAIDNARLHAEVQTLAVTDGLTGLANRRAFDHALEVEVARAARYGYPISLIIADIDNFKVYNDTYGHPAGDERLKAIADLLRATLRDPDLAARYGGEELALVLPHTDKEGALALAERIRAAAEAAFRNRGSAGDTSLGIPGYTLSIGVAVFPDDATRPEDLLLTADFAALNAKRLGKNRVCAAEKIGS
ncbi:MAG: GAF domain-containing protein [Chloroflexi bacterium]|nr:GAF domain-containing protein [Chloroflexota bacterium]